MKLIVISPPEHISHEAATINALFDEGLQVYHLRKPGWSVIEMDAIVKKIKEEYRGKVAIHSNHTHAKSWGISRLHFPERERKKMPMEVFDDLKSSTTLSTAVHSMEDARKITDAFEYVFCSPVLPSISKQGYHTNEDWSGIKKLSANCIALGGIEEDSIAKVMTMGFRGVAILGAIWSSDQPVKKFQSIREYAEEINLSKQWTE